MKNIIDSSLIYANALYNADLEISKYKVLDYYYEVINNLPDSILVNINCTLNSFLKSLNRMIWVSDNDIYICVSKEYLNQFFRKGTKREVLDYLDKCYINIKEKKINKTLKKK